MENPRSEPTLFKMDTKEFKKIFGSVAQSYGFKSEHGVWTMESDECLVALLLQKSNYGSYYYLNINIFIRDLFGKTFVKSKTLLKNNTGHIIRGAPPEFGDALNLDILSDDSRIEELFSSFV